VTRFKILIAMQFAMHSATSIKASRSKLLQDVLLQDVLLKYLARYAPVFLSKIAIAVIGIFLAFIFLHKH